MFAFNPILAVGGWFSILFLVIAFVSWLWNVFNGNQNAQAGGARQMPRPGGGKRENELQSEINRFLKNVMGQKPEREDELEVLDDDDANAQRRRQKAARSKNRPAKRENMTGSSMAESSSSAGDVRPGGRIAQRKGPGSSNLGSGVRQHVADHMQEGRVLQQAQDFLAHGVAEKVQHNLGTFTGIAPAGAAATVTSSRQTATALSVAKMMRDPVSLKEAFVLNLILDRPKLGQRK